MGLALQKSSLKGFGWGFIFGVLTPTFYIVGLTAFGYATISVGKISLGSLIMETLPLEWILRGYLLQLFIETGGLWTGAIITGILFGAAHSLNPGANP